MVAPHEPVDIDAIVVRLRERVAERRAAGEYPPELEERLSDHFRRIMAHRKQDPPPQGTYLEDLARRLGPSADFGLHRINFDSQLPGGSTLHRAVARATARQTAGLIEQLNRYAELVNELLVALVATVEAPPRHFHDDLWEQIDGLLDRLAKAESAEAAGPAAVAALADRVAVLEATAGRAPFRPWYSDEAFEAEFRGSREEILGRYESLADQLVGCGPVLDIGCGRGELLELLAARDVPAFGVEIDRALVASCVDRGLDVRHGDGLAVLRDTQASSLGGVTMVQVIEHLTPQQAVDVVALAADRVRAGGRVVVETVNPQSLYVYAHAFYLDPTHVRPVHPSWLLFLFREAGFAEVTIEWRSPAPEEDVLEVGGGEAHDANVARLNELLFAPQDYAVIATR